MICKVCGRDMENESANFCSYCGSSFREDFNPTELNYQNQYNNQNTGDSRDQYQSSVDENLEKPVSFKNWFGTMFIGFIPFVGPFIYLVMMFVWAFGSKTPKSKQNWARVQLILVFVLIILTILFVMPAFIEILNNPDAYYTPSLYL